jgi:hypothetical protein
MSRLFLGAALLVGLAALPPAARADAVQGLEPAAVTAHADDWDYERFGRDLRLAARRSARDARRQAWEMRSDMRREMQRAAREMRRGMREMRDQIREAARELRRSLREELRGDRHSWSRRGRI